MVTAVISEQSGMIHSLSPVALRILQITDKIHFAYIQFQSEGSEYPAPKSNFQPNWTSMPLKQCQTLSTSMSCIP